MIGLTRPAESAGSRVGWRSVGCACAVIQHRVDQHQAGDGPQTSVSCQQGERGSKPAAGAVAHDHQIAGVHALRRSVAEYPFQRCVTVLQRDRERMLGGKPVIDGNDDCLELDGQLGQVIIGHLRAAQYKAAAMDIQNDREVGVRV